jgi:hypothetical protein
MARGWSAITSRYYVPGFLVKAIVVFVTTKAPNDAQGKGDLINIRTSM